MPSSFDLLPAWFVLPVAFIFGTVVGSFVNVLIYRIPEGISVVTPPSRCPHCEHQLAPRDLIPLLSFLMAGRKCRYCGAPVSWQYFWIELLTGLMFMATITVAGPTLNGVLLCLFVASLIASFFIDLWHFIIPDELNYFGVIVGVLRALVGPHAQWIDFWGRPVTKTSHTIPAVLLGAVALPALLWLITKGGTLMFRKQIAEQQKQWDEAGILEEGEELEAMGMGDVKLAAAMGANLGFIGGLVGLFIGVALGAVVGIFLKASKRLEGHAIPFGPYLIAGTMATLFFGPEILRWYLRLIGQG